MAAERVSPGSSAASVPFVTDSAVINDALDLLARNRRGDLDRHGRTKQPGPLGTDFVMVKNVSGDARERGEVLMLGDALLDEDAYNLWFEADTPAGPDNLHYTIGKCAVLDEPLAEDAIGKAHAQGVCVARVNVVESTHRFARPKDGEHYLETADAGPFELLGDLGIAAGDEQLYAVRFMPETVRARWYASCLTHSPGIMTALFSGGGLTGFDALPGNAGIKALVPGFFDIFFGLYATSECDAVLTINGANQIGIEAGVPGPGTTYYNGMSATIGRLLEKDDEISVTLSTTSGAPATLKCWLAVKYVGPR